MKLLKSRTFWTLVLMVFTSIAQAIEPQVSAEVFALIQTILGAFAAYFKIKPSQKYD